MEKHFFWQEEKTKWKREETEIKGGKKENRWNLCKNSNTGNSLNED